MGIDILEFRQKRKTTLKLLGNIINSRIIERPPAVFFEKKVHVSPMLYDPVSDKCYECEESIINATPINDFEDYESSCDTTDFIAIAPEHHLDWLKTLVQITEFKLLSIVPEIEIPIFENGIFTFPDGRSIHLEESAVFPGITPSDTVPFEEYQRKTIELWNQIERNSQEKIRLGLPIQYVQISQKITMIEEIVGKMASAFISVDKRLEAIEQRQKDTGVNLLSYELGHIVVYGYYSASDLAKKYGCELTSRIKQDLTRFRSAHFDDSWIQCTNPRRGNEKFMYREDAVEGIFRSSQ